MFNPGMARQKREDYSGAWHHVMNRGARKAPIFRHVDHCTLFLSILGEAVERFGVEIHAYSLMPNHYHLLVRVPLGNLSQCLRHINGTYTQWLNRRHAWDGPVFRGRFRSQLIEKEDYLRLLIAYIHLNPLKAGLVTKIDSSAWTSHLAYMGKESGPDWLRSDVFLDLFDGKKALREFILSVHQHVIDFPEDFNPETGLFQKKAIVRDAPSMTSATDRRSQGGIAKQAQEILSAVCRITGVSKHDLLRQEMGPGANPARRLAIWALSQGTGLTHQDIAKALQVPRAQVPKLLSRIRKGQIADPLGEWMSIWRSQA